MSDVTARGAHLIKMAVLAVFLPALVAITAVFGLDADFQVDLIRELDLANATHGISQTAGLHNSSKAFHFQDARRTIQVPSQITDQILELLRNKNEFTFMASIQQKASTSGVFFSIHESEHSYFELESSGLREEIRYRYCHKGKQRSETFPYRLADGQWHKIALSISASQLLLHVDCNRIYERELGPFEMNLSAGSRIWIGQRSQGHGLFKGSMQDVRFVFSSNGYMVQCPSLNRTCPTCSDFLSLVQGIMDLQDLLSKMTLKLNYAESRLSQLESCHCERTCSVNDVTYRDKELWTEPENCRTCACMDGAVECRRIFCPPVNCSEDFLPVHVNGTCCKKCRSKCSYLGRALSEGQRVFLQSCKECKNGVMEPVDESCPSLNCTINEQILPENRCCNVCRGHDFCAERVLCGENSLCKNRNNKAECECRSGYTAIQGDSTYCEDIDECSTQMHYCQANTVCVNLPGGHRCDCLPGFSRVDDFSCTERDECVSGQSSCDENAICTNTVHGHLCTCKPGFMGNGTICTDVDECVEGFAQCHTRSLCANLPGWYHCQCRSGFHDDGSHLPDGSSCVDIDECTMHTHTCWNDSVCVNLPGTFDCVCVNGPECTGDCIQGEELKHNGQEWSLGHDHCTVCTCKDGRVFCRRRACDCSDPDLDLSCCPECDTRQSSQCVHQNGYTLYHSGESWIYNCQKCRCLEGDVECLSLSCPVLLCNHSTVLEGECCPRCIFDPCIDDTQTSDPTQTCRDPTGIARLSGAMWSDPSAPCTTCKCKNGRICCSVDLDCVQDD
ncbi:protein kinase C-binding protein NELL1 isoform X2 [Tachysurus fulvidraco]|uniref:protein kinase C-binding protein NELL1 isoform X2 n=1 Tax=Tachysurus fulvidraco TaxID=1234273 RepID=UPI001FEE91CD|nr:protein kinase C-binding protein NELL1 isoform X2 [Tachysurus fulvidraco]